MMRRAGVAGWPGLIARLLCRAGLCLGLLGGAGIAQDIGPPLDGSYQVEGQNFEGKAYTGTAEIRSTDDVSCTINWEIAGTSSEGVCLRKGDTVSAAVVQAGNLVVVVFDLGADGSLSGFWTILGTPGVGFEQLTPM